MEDGRNCRRAHIKKIEEKASTNLRAKALKNYRRILNENLISRLDHAVYSDREPTKAKVVLKDGKEYKQE